MYKRFICIMMAFLLAISTGACQSASEQADASTTNPKTSSTAQGTSSANKGTPESSEDSLALFDEKEIGANSTLKSPEISCVNSKGQLVVLDNEDGKNVRFVTLDAEGKPVGEVKSILPGMVRTFALDSQDHILAAISEQGSDEQTSQKICVIDSTGAINNTFELGKYKMDGAPGKVPIVMDIALDFSDNIFVATLSGVKVLDKNGKETAKIGNDSYYSVDSTADGKIVALHSAAGKQEIVMIDPATGDNIWTADLMQEGSEGARTSFSVEAMKVRYDKSDKSICYMDGQGVVRYDSTGKLIGEVLTFKQHYMILASGNGPVCLSIDLKGNFYILTRSQGKYEILRYDIEAGTHKVKKRKILTLAVPSAARWLEVAAIKFQKVNSDYSVNIKSYEQADQNEKRGDNENYVKTLNTELLTGKGPDIISTNGLSSEKYMDRNIIADLSEYMEKDASFDESRYFTNIFDAFKYKDKLYMLPASVNFDVLAANQEMLDQKSLMIDDTSWNWNEFKQVAEKLTGKSSGKAANCTLFPEGVGSGLLLENMLKGNYSSFVDSDQKKASFNSKEFIDLLEMVEGYGDNKLSDTVVISGSNYVDPDSLDRGTVVYSMQTFIDYTGYAFLSGIYKDKLKLLRYPSAGGGYKGGFNSDSIFAINNNSKNKDAAWEFLKFLLSEDIQSDELDGFAINKAALKKSAQRAIEMTNSGGMMVAISTKGEGKPQIITPKKLTQEDIDYVNGFIEGMKSYNYNNSEVKKIILDEAGAFFAGNKTAKDAAGIIQQKASIYLGE